MRTMRRACRHPDVAVVHSYEDCSLWSFEEAKRLGKTCVYEMPIGYYPAWEDRQRQLVERYSDWLPSGALASTKFVRPTQKKREMELADLVMAPSTYVRETIQRYCDKPVAIAPYGVDANFWQPTSQERADGPLRFLYVGHVSVRKGAPFLMDAWRKADLKNSRLDLIGNWQLADRVALPNNVHHTGPCDSVELRRRFQQADVFVFPSFFEGFGMVLLEAMACGLPAITTDSTAGPDIIDESNGRICGSGDMDELVESLVFFQHHANRLGDMGRSARVRAEECSWPNYRRALSQAISKLK